jgi:hypothetical protein
MLYLCAQAEGADPCQTILGLMLRKTASPAVSLVGQYHELLQQRRRDQQIDEFKGR